MSDPLAGGHAGESPYRYDPAARLSLTMGYSRDPLHDSRYPWWVPPCNRCAWSPEIARERTRVMEIDNQIFAAVEVARARQLAEARYSEQRRQALAAILYGVVIMVLVIAAAGG